jgi:hypothetical protein
MLRRATNLTVAERLVGGPLFSAVRLVGAGCCISATYPEAHLVGPVAHCAAASLAAAEGL